MSYTIRTESDIDNFFTSENFNSEIFGDENTNMQADMLALLKDAKKYGCVFEGDIPTWWGTTIHVVANPYFKKHTWRF